jgi:hypothetical protein
MLIEVTDPRGIHKVNVELENISQDQYNSIIAYFGESTQMLRPSKSVAATYLFAIETCPLANPADLWWHCIYRTYLARYGTDQSWKRTAGFALEDVFVSFYRPLLKPYGILISTITGGNAYAAMIAMGIGNKIGKSKIDIILQGEMPDLTTKIFGGIHVKSSLAERIQDDVPASVAMMNAGYWSGFMTLDAKAFPPPHGDAVVRGELGLRNDPEGALKRNYFERDGQFDNCYSYNLRTIPSPERTSSGKKIYKLSFHDPKPDQFMRDVIDAWNQRKG